MCFACGPRNVRGLRLQFELDHEKRRLKTRWVPTKDLQGYRDIVHGGMVGLVLDEMMVNLLWTLQEPSVTADLTLKLRLPARVNEPLDCESWIVEQAGRIFRMAAEARNARSEVVARTTARCVRMSPEF